MELRHIAQRSGRLSSFLRGEMALSSGLMNRLKWEDKLLVNGQSRHTDYQVQPGDEIVALLDEPAPEYPAEDLPLEILYEDEHVLVVDKPAGMLIHPSRNRDTGTLANAVAGYYRRTGQAAAFHPLTRLDRDTYGVVLLGKHSHSHARLQELARQGQVTKTYQALVWGGPAQDAGSIEAPIARLPLPSLLRQVSPDGKYSRTEFTVLARYEKTSLLELVPVTGRTHQLRIHCAYKGFPILGDPQYGTEASQGLSRQMGLETQRLCAKRICFTHPVTEARITVESRQRAEVD